MIWEGFLMNYTFVRKPMFNNSHISQKISAFYINLLFLNGLLKYLCKKPLNMFGLLHVNELYYIVIVSFERR